MYCHGALNPRDQIDLKLFFSGEFLSPGGDTSIHLFFAGIKIRKNHEQLAGKLSRVPFPAI